MKTPPYSQEAESMVIGCVAEFPTVWPAISGDLIAGDFFTRHAREAWEIASELDRRGVVVTGFEISAHALSLGKKELAVWVQEQAESVPGQSNIRAYVRVIREKAIDRQMIVAAMRMYEIAEDTKPQAERIAEVHRVALEIGKDQNEHSQTIAEVMPGVFEEIEQRRRHGLTGVSTGFRNLDKRWGGMARQAVIVIAGRPRMGKTTLALNIAENVASIGGRVLVFSLEMGAAELTEKSLASRGGVNYADILSGAVLDNSEQCERLTKASMELKQFDLTIADRSAVSMANIRSLARRHHAKKPIDLLVIDYLQLIEGGNQGSYERITDITRRVKLLAMELSVPVLLLSQLNRKADDRASGDNRPRLADLRDSGSIEQDADLVAFVYRDVIYNEHTLAPNAAEVITAKHRKGQQGTDYLREELSRSRFCYQEGLKPDYGTVKPMRRGIEA